MRVTDRWTDRQNYDSQDCASIAALRGKKERKSIYIAPFYYARILAKRSDMDHTVLPAK